MRLGVSGYVQRGRGRLVEGLFGLVLMLARDRGPHGMAAPRGDEADQFEDRRCDRPADLAQDSGVRAGELGCSDVTRIR